MNPEEMEPLARCAECSAWMTATMRLNEHMLCPKCQAPALASEEAPPTLPSHAHGEPSGIKVSTHRDAATNTLCVDVTVVPHGRVSLETVQSAVAKLQQMESLKDGFYEFPSHINPILPEGLLDGPEPEKIRWWPRYGKEKDK